MAISLAPSRSLLASAASHIFRIRYLDCDALVYTDSDAFSRSFQHMYRRLTTPASADQHAELQYGVFESSTNPWGRPVVILSQDVWPIDHPAILHWFGHEGVITDMLRHVRSHFVIHAGVVEKNGNAVLLVGDSTFGKTTLVLELVRRGFRLLSDDLAPISRSENRVDAFPRSLRIREGTLDLVGVDVPSTAQVSRWMDKLVVDVEALFPNSVSHSARIRYLITLYDRRAPDLSVQLQKPLRIWVERVPDSLLAFLQDHPEVDRVDIESYEGFPLLTVHTANKPAILRQIEEQMHLAKVPVLNIWRRDEHHPAFDGPVSLEPVSVSQILSDLLQQFQPGLHSKILQEYGNRPGMFLMDLAASLSDIQCYRLQVGSLAEMADLISALSF